MISEELLNSLKSKYASIHPLLFHRSKERAKTGGELFDMLDTMPDKFPITWNEGTKRWVHTVDLFQAKAFPARDKE